MLKVWFCPEDVQFQVSSQVNFEFTFQNDWNATHLVYLVAIDEQQKNVNLINTEGMVDFHRER